MSTNGALPRTCPCCGKLLMRGQIGADVRLTVSIRGGGGRTELVAPVCVDCSSHAQDSVRAATEVLKAVADELLRDVDMPVETF